MFRQSLVTLALACAVTAQDFVFPLGYGNASGPPNSSYPVVRVRDQNGNGIIEAEECHAFCTTLPTGASSGTNFMTDGRWVREDGNVVFYFTDSEDGQVIRGEDSNHNGVIDPGEAVRFFHFGLTSSGGALFTPDTLGVYRDVAAGETRVYVALDNGSASANGYTHGIHRLVDNNGDGDAMDPGEHSMFVDNTMNLQVPGLSGPVTISRDYWSRVRVLPGGKVIAYAKGLPIDGTLIPNSNPPAYTYSVQSEMNCWYGFTDNNGTAVPEVWFNASTLNNLPVHPDFDDPRSSTTSVYPNWDIQDATAVSPPTRVCYARFCDVVAGGGPNGEDVYYLAASYRKAVEGDTNLNGQPVSGLIYRVIDANANQVIDSGEISLYFNLSGSTYTGVPSGSFLNELQQPVYQLGSITRAFSTSSTGSVSLCHNDDGVLTMFDANQNGVIEPGEAHVPFVTPTNSAGALPPFSQQYGPFFTSLVGIGALEMPGPFGPGVQTVGDACMTSAGKKPVMEVWNGFPQVGNQAIEIGCIRALPVQPAFLMGDLVLAPSPLNLGNFGLGSGCYSYLGNPMQVAVTISDLEGTHRFSAPLPNVAAVVGINLAFQFAIFDQFVTTPVTYVVSNAMVWTIQA